MTTATLTPLPNDHDGDDPAAMAREIDSLRQQVARLAFGADYLHPAQVHHLLAPINPKRVSTEGVQKAHLEAYDVRRVLISVFGFARWSGDVVDSWQLYEHVSEAGQDNDGRTIYRVSVGYRVRFRLTVCGPNGTVLATYTEEACGDATNFPISKRADAHDFAVKTAESQALKRCATNLGDQFGLSLYNKGSRDALVVRTLIDPRQDPAPLAGPAASGPPRNAAGPGVDEHITEQLAPEDPPAADTEAGDPRVTNSSPATPGPPATPPSAGAGPVAGEDPTPSPAAAQAADLYARASALVSKAAGERIGPLGELLTEATKAKVKAVRVGPQNRTLQSVLMGMLGDARRDHDAARLAAQGGGGSE